LASGTNKTEAKRVSNLKKKKPIWPRVQRKPRPKGIEFKKKAHMASGGTKIEAKRLGSMASGSI